MASTDGSPRIHAEAHGAHWVAWISRDASAKPDRSIVIIAQTEEEARDRARRWAEQGSY